MPSNEAVYGAAFAFVVLVVFFAGGRLLPHREPEADGDQLAEAYHELSTTERRADAAERRADAAERAQAAAEQRAADAERAVQNGEELFARLEGMQDQIGRLTHDLQVAHARIAELERQNDARPEA